MAIAIPTVRLKRPHAKQAAFLASPKSRKIIKAGRRSGKTTGLAILAVQQFLAGGRVLYFSPTAEQIMRFWQEVSLALFEPIDAGVFRKNQTLHLIDLPGTEQCIRAKTAWDPDHLRGDYGSLLICDEYQMMSEHCWGEVIAPMTLDKNADCVFSFTPPSIRTFGISKASDPRHAAKLFVRAQNDTEGRWEAFHFTSFDNPHLSSRALDEITQDMSSLAYRQEILAELIDEIPGALWTHALIESTRVRPEEVPELVRVAVALDPSATSQETADEMGLIVGGRSAHGHGYTLRDASQRGTPAACARQAILLYDQYEADVIVAEVNNGGEWIGTVVQFVAAEMHRQGLRTTARVNFKMVHASRGKQTRAEPIATEFEHGRCHHVGVFPTLEDEQCSWVPGMRSPNRMDAEVWLYTELLLNQPRPAGTMALRF